MTKGKCPLCNTPVVFFSEGRRYNMRPDMGSSVLIQAYGYHKLAVRYFNISYDYRCNRLPEESVFETYRTIIDYDKKTQLITLTGILMDLKCPGIKSRLL